MTFGFEDEQNSEEDLTESVAAPEVSSSPLTEEEESKKVLPGVIRLAAAEFMPLPREEALTKLKDVYTSTSWEDDTEAAEQFAEAADSINRLHGVVPDSGLKESFADTLKFILMEDHEEDEKLEKIEEEYQRVRQNIYVNPSDVDSLLKAKQKERELDVIRLYLRRNVISKDKGKLMDMLARGASATAMPLAGASDVLFETDFSKSLQSYTIESTNPEYDDDISSVAASVAGNIAGVVASHLVPGGPAAYLGSMLITQSMDTYNATLEATKDSDAAENAMIEALPFNVLDGLGDRLVGGWVGKVLQKKALSPGITKKIATGFLAEAIPEALQEYGSGSTIAKYTDNPEFNPDEKELLTAFLAGGAAGSIFGGIAGVANKYRNMDPIKLQEMIDSIRTKRVKEEVLQTAAKRSGESVESLRDAVNDTEYADGRELFTQMEDTLIKKTHPELSQDSQDVERSASEVVLEDFTGESADTETDSIPIRTDAEAVKTDKDSPDDLPPNIYFGDNSLFKPSEDATSFVLSSHIAKEMGLDISAQFLAKRTAGRYSVANKTIEITRRIFKGPSDASRTFNHELSHALDDAASAEDGFFKKGVTGEELNKWRAVPAFQKMFRVYRDFSKEPKTEAEFQLNKDIHTLGMLWSPYNTTPGSHSAEYRGRGTEQFANAMSALLSEPAQVRDKFPRVWDAFLKATELHPDLNKLMNLISQAKSDPTVLYKIYSKEKAVGQNLEEKIIRDKTSERFKEKISRAREMTRQSWDWFRTTFTDSTAHAKDAGKVLIKTEAKPREWVYEQFARLQADSTTWATLNTFVDDPMKKTLNSLESKVRGTPEEIAKNLANYFDIQHVINDTNATIDNIKENPDQFHAAIKDMSEYFGNPKLYDSVAHLKGEELVAQLSKIHGKFEPEELARVQKDMIARENFLAAELLERAAFDVRRFMPNSFIDYKSAPATLESFKAFVGEQDYKAYEEAALKIHKDVGHQIIKSLVDANLVDAKTLDKLKRNVDHFSSQNILKYFQEDARIPGTIRKAIGSFERTGNALISYAGKAKAVMLRAAYQQTQNSAWNIADASGVPMRKVEPRRIKTSKKLYQTSLWDTKAVLESKNKDKSYIIRTEEGTSELWEIDDPDYAKMFGDGNLGEIPVVKQVAALSESLNNLTLTRWGKTLGSWSFIYGSKFRDTNREAFMAGSWEVLWKRLFLMPGHTNKEMKTKKAEFVRDAYAMLTEGKISEMLQIMLDHHGITYSLLREFDSTHKNQHSFEEALYDKMGRPLPEDLFISEKINKEAINFIRKLPFMSKMELMAQVDELATKQMGFWIAKEKLGKGNWEAATIARERFGTPDPSGGGRDMATVNKLFFFSRAHANGVRAQVDMIKDDPSKYMQQYIYRKLIPRLMLSSPLMGPIIGAMFGEESEKIARKFLDKIPSYIKMGKFVIPLGFTDANNVMRYFDVNSDEIGPGWKAAAITIPLDRDLISLDQILEPAFNAIENLLSNGDISGKQIAEDAVSSFGQVFGGSMSMGLQTVSHIPGLLYGNPQDYFRKRGILSNDVAEAGSLVRRFYDYAVWAMHNNYPAMFGSTPKVLSSEPTSPLDMLKQIPQAGAVLRSFLITTNYGDLEKSKEAEAYRKKIDSDIRLGMGTETKKAYYDMGRLAGLARRLGKAETAQLAPEIRQEMHKYNKWKSSMYTKALQASRDAYLMGDTERVKEISDQLEKYTAEYFKPIN